MTDNNDTLQLLVNYGMLFQNRPEIPKKVFFETSEREWIHGVSRLLLLTEGRAEVSYVKNGKSCCEVIEAPAMLFCSLNAVMSLDMLMPGKCLSFSYFSGYIRSMLVDYDGVHSPPTSRDVFFHSNNPLSECGQGMLDNIELLIKNQKVFLCKDLMNALYYMTIQDLEKSTEGNSPGKMCILWTKISSFMREHRTENISRSQLARIFKIAPGYLSELSRKYGGDSFSNIRLKYQLEYAAQLLVYSRFSVDEIADKAGFSSANYFIRRFKKVYNTTPHVYRNQHIE